MLDSTDVSPIHDLAKRVLARVVDDLGVLLARSLRIESVSARRTPNKVAGARQVHIAFKLGVTIDAGPQHGAFLVPLPEAISFAGYLMMERDEAVAQRRCSKQLDRSHKDAMVEVGNLIAGSIDSAMQAAFPGRISVRSTGCQGLKPGLAPAFDRLPGVDLVVTRARMKLHEYPSFDAILMLPMVPAAA